jgi:hypothetical protein
MRVCPTCSKIQKEEKKATLMEEQRKDQQMFEKKQV